MKKLIIILLLIIGIFSSFAMASIYFADYEKIYDKFLETYKLDKNAIKKTNFTINKFPFPYILIDEITESKKIKLKNVKIYFILTSLFGNNPSISKVKISEAFIYLMHDDIHLMSHDEFISELINKGSFLTKAHIKELNFVDSNLNTPIKINNFDFIGQEKSFLFSGFINSTDYLSGSFAPYNHDNNKIDFNLDISGNNYNIKLYEHYENTKLKIGKVTLTTKNLANQFTNFFPEIGNIIKKIKNDYLVSNLDANLNQIKPTLGAKPSNLESEEIKISFDITPDQSWTNLRNIIFDSNSIQGTGEIILSKNPTNITNDIKLNFSKVDIEAFSTPVSVESNYSLPLLDHNSFSKLDFKKNRIQASLFIKDLYHGNESVLNNINFRSRIEDGDFKIDNLTGDINQSGKFEIKGSAQKNSFRTLFNGKMSLAHYDLNQLNNILRDPTLSNSREKLPFTMTANIKLSSVDLAIQDLLITTLGPKISGDVSIKFIGSIPRISSNLKFSNIDLDKQNLPIINNLYLRGISLTDDMKNQDYLNKFVPLRKVNSYSNHNISFDQLTLNGKLYSNINFAIGVKPGVINIDNIYIINKQGDYLDAAINISAEELKPTLKFMIYDGIIRVGFLSPNAALHFRQELLDRYAFDKVNIELDFKLAKVYQDNFEIQNLNFKATNNKNLFEIKQLEADLLGGRTSMSGSILLTPYTINFVYALSNAQVTELIKIFPVIGVFNTAGIVNATGMVSTYGTTLPEQLYNLYTKSDVTMSNITINNISIDEMIKKLNNPNYNPKNLNFDIKNAALTGKTEIKELTASVNLTKGNVTIPSISFKTNFAAGMANATFNLYDFNLNLASVLSFYLLPPVLSSDNNNYRDAKAVSFKLNSTGSIFAPQKEIITPEIESNFELKK